MQYKASSSDSRWSTISYEDYHKSIQAVARAFVNLGLEQLRAVAILGFNSPEWFLSEMGAIYAGGMVRSKCYYTRRLNIHHTVLYYSTGKLAPEKVIVVVPLEQVRKEGSRVSFHCGSE